MKKGDIIVTIGSLQSLAVAAIPGEGLARK
jgi:hypothetical protein